jgi:hypothetical protein
MKKTLLFLTLFLAAAVLVILLPNGAKAAVDGRCDGCHTMHYSQDGLAPEDPAAGPYAHLLLSDCIGCHSGADSASTVGGAPSVNMTYTNALDDVSGGGSFDTYNNAAVDESERDARVHNATIAGLDIDPEDTIKNIPGNGTNGMNNNVGSTDVQALTCAGANGCHGVISIGTMTNPDAGIRGFHHGSTAYRFLKTTEAGYPDVDGEGSGNWEDGTGSLGGAGSNNHNVYFSDPASDNTIDKLCANCHPNFHAETRDATDSNWIRHPSEFEFVDAAQSTGGWDLSQLETSYKLNPFGFTDLTAVSPTTAYSASTSGAAVSCLSCHRAHGTPYADLLRFDYDEQEAGTGATTGVGCLGCHYLQR